MGVGALFVALNLAAIRELIKLAHMVTWSQAAILAALSLVVMQAFTMASTVNILRMAASLSRRSSFA